MNDNKRIFSLKIKMNSIYKQYFFGLTTFLLAVISILILRHYISDKSVSLPIRIPKFKTVDINGHILDSRQLIGKATFFQFVNPFDPNDIELIQDVYKNWSDDKINIVVFAKDIDKFKKKVRFNENVLHVVSEKYEDIFKIFKGNNGYYISDHKGRIVKYGSSKDAYLKEVKSQLFDIVKHDVFSVYDLIDKKKDIHDIEWMRQVSELIKTENKDYFLISFLTKICDSCSGGSIIQNLKFINSYDNRKVLVVSILPGDFKMEDVLNLRSQLNVNFPVLIADESLNRKWNSFIEKYSENDLTEIVLFGDKTGEILEAADNKCRCWDKLFNKALSMLKSSSR